MNKKLFWVYLVSVFFIGNVLLANSNQNLTKMMKELTKRTEELIDIVKDDNVTPSLLKEVMSLEEMIYREFSKISETMTNIISEKKVTPQNRRLIDLYLNLSNKYAKLINRMVVLGKKIKLKAFQNPVYLAVMVENSSRARPQSGHSLADVFYEIPVEGGITRYMLIFPKSKFKDHYLLEPVRSARDYFIFLAQEYDALYIHCGGSPLAYAYFDKYKFRHIDQIHTPSAPFFRDKQRHAPHNLCVYTDKLLKWIERRRKTYLYGKKPFPWKFKPNLCVEMERDCVPANKLFLNFYHHYHVKYVFNKATNLYERYINGKPDMDNFTKKINTTSNIVVQFAKMKIIDKEGRLKVSYTGSGPGLFLQKGKLLKIKWRKEKQFSPTHFYYKNKELEFLPGKIDIIFMLVLILNVYKLFLQVQLVREQNYP
jgi:hypothetical protein